MAISIKYVFYRYRTHHHLRNIEYNRRCKAHTQKNTRKKQHTARWENFKFFNFPSKRGFGLFKKLSFHKEFLVCIACMHIKYFIHISVVRLLKEFFGYTLTYERCYGESILFYSCSLTIMTKCRTSIFTFQ